MSEAVPDLNLFMMCRRLNRDALSDLPPGFHLRLCRPDELDLWKDMQLLNTGGTPRSYIDGYFTKWYAPKGDLFFQRCTFACNSQDEPVGSAFLWKQYDLYTTVHWVKVLPEYEGRGLGRALLSHLLRDLPSADYPVYLHTHPSCNRAVKLYSDFGFALLSEPALIDGRSNDVAEALPFLQRLMPEADFRRLRLVRPDEE